MREIGGHFCQETTYAIREPFHREHVLPSVCFQAGDVLISNHTSFLDVLYLASRFLPLFTAFSYGPEVRLKRHTERPSCVRPKWPHILIWSPLLPPVVICLSEHPLHVCWDGR